MSDTSLSVDAAVGLLDAAKEPETEAPAVEAATEETPADEQVEAEPAAENPEEPDEASQGDEEVEPETPAVEPPHYWSAEAKARFAELPPDLQATVMEQENGRESAVQKSQQEAAEARKKADAETQTVSQVSQVLQKWLPQAIETFKSRWDDVDWAAWVDQDPEAAFKGKLAYDAEREQLQQLQAARQESERIERGRREKAEAEQLKVIAPALADPKDGPRRQQELASYLTSQGVPKEQLSDISAVAASLAYKAMLWDRAQTSLKTTPPKIAAKALKPSAAQSGSSQSREADRVKNRFAQTRSIDDAVALLNTRGTA